MTHECLKEQLWGRVLEFMEEFKGLRGVLYGIVGVIATQVIIFAFMWGGLTTTVKKHDVDIAAVMAMFKNVKIISIAVAGEKGEKGDRGDQGIPGKQSVNYLYGE